MSVLLLSYGPSKKTLAASWTWLATVTQKLVEEVVVKEAPEARVDPSAFINVYAPLPKLQHRPSPYESEITRSWQPIGTHIVIGACGYAPLEGARV